MKNIAIVISNWDNESTLIQDLLLSEDSWVEASNNGRIGSDDKAKIFDIVDIEMKIEFISGVILVEKRSTSDSWP